jgi:ATP-binding cassette, subfamily B, bacterial
MPDSGEKNSLSKRWKRFLALLPYVPATVRLVWRAAPRWMIFWASLLVIQGLLPVGVAYLTRGIVNRVVEMLRAPGHDLSPIVPLAIIMAAVLLLGEVVNSLFTWAKATQADFIWAHVIEAVHAESSSVQMGFFDSPEFYDRIYRAQNEGPIRALTLIESMGSMAQDGITLVGIFVIILPYGAWLPLMLIASTVPALFVLFHYTVEQYRLRIRSTSELRRQAYYNSVLTGREAAPEIRLFGIGNWFRARHNEIADRLRDRDLAIGRRQALGEALAAIAGLAATAGALLPTAYQAFQGQVSLGTLAFVYQVFQSGLRSVRSLSAQLVHIYAHTVYLEDLFRFLELPVEPLDASSAPPRPADKVEGCIVFRNVSFRYPDARGLVLDRFDLRIPAGSKVAILGANGSGKSTLIRLLCRFYEPLDGAIELDGVDLRGIPLAQLRRHMAVLFQDPMRYNATVSENIRLGDLDSHATEETLRDAARGSGAAHFIDALPDGYRTILGRRFTGGAELSVGEWQQLSLARAYYRNAPVLILDEPTSAMDPWAEAEWMSRFRALAEGKTAILITHRLSTALVADTIHLIKNGRVLESGTHEELLAHGLEYAAAWASQMRPRRV